MASQSGRKKAHKHKLFVLVNVQRPWDKRLVVPGLTGPKSLCVRLETQEIYTFPSGQPAGCPRVVPTFKKFMCSKFMCLFLALHKLRSNFSQQSSLVTQYKKADKHELVGAVALSKTCDPKV